jgi:hypothetical protein
LAEGTDGQETRRKLAEALDDALKENLPPTAPWPDLVKAPRHGNWPDRTIDGLETPLLSVAHEAAAETRPEGERDLLPAFGLIVWLRDFYAQLGQAISHGLFSDYDDGNAYIQEAFPWLLHELRLFKEEHFGSGAASGRTGNGLLRWRVDKRGDPADILGSGGEALVFRGTFHRNVVAGEAVAVKRIPFGPTPRTGGSEWAQLCKLHHPNIVR